MFSRKAMSNDDDRQFEGGNKAPAGSLALR